MRFFGMYRFYISKQLCVHLILVSVNIVGIMVSLFANRVSGIPLFYRVSSCVYQCFIVFFLTCLHSGVFQWVRARDRPGGNPEIFKR